MRGIKACARVFALAWSAGPGAAILSVGEVLGAVLRFAQPLVLAWLVDSVLARDTMAATFAGTVFVASLATSASFETLAIAARVRLIDKIGRLFDQQFLAAVGKIQSLDTLESTPVAAGIRRIEDRADAMGYVYNALFSVLIYAAAPLTSITVALIIDPRLLLLVLASIPVVLLAGLANGRTARAEDVTDSHVEKMKDWSSLLRAGNARMERSAYRLWPWYRTNVVSHVQARERTLGKAGRFEASTGFLGEAVFLIALAGLLSWLVLWPAEGFTTGTAVAAFAVGLDLRGALGALRFAFGGLGPGIRSAIALQDLVDVTRDAADNDARQHPDNTTANKRSVGPITYTYPNGTVALDGLELEVPEGSVIAVVGDNGSGKTTLMEVLLGLRLPGLLRRANTSSRAAMPQAFGRPEFELQQAITMGRAGDGAMQRLGQVAPRDFWTHRGGASMQLGATWEGGTDLSGGEWQVLAAARALLQPSDVLILDEPTAALDPEAREQVTASLLEAARRCAADGGVAFVVTHSMAIPHRTDYIAVMSEGKLEEFGTHQQLIETNGSYARMYALATGAFEP